MDSMIVKWGNSQGVRLPKELLAEASLRVGDAVALSADRNGIRIRKAAPAHRTLAQRLDGYGGAYRPSEWDTGSPVGKETT